MTKTIQSIIARADAVLTAPLTETMEVARERADLSRLIAARYPVFEALRDGLLGRKSLRVVPAHDQLIDMAAKAAVVDWSSDGWRVASNPARRYLTGGWLEEYVALAVVEIGADEVLVGQKLRWRVGEYSGENEIDVLARFGGQLFMCSCKALKSALMPDDARTRERLMHAMHEADNLADHFAPDVGTVALAVTTDLMDESSGLARYQQLHGKAAVLGVSLIALDDLRWPNLLERLRGIISSLGTGL